MAFSITEWKSRLRNGGARPNQFLARISPPPAVSPTRGNSFNGQEQFQFMCKSASIPSDSVNKIDYPIPGGRTIPVLGDKPTPEDLTLTITNDEGFEIRDFFEDWLSQYREHVQNITTVPGDPSQYYGVIDIIQYSKTAAPIKTYKYENAMLTNISSIDLSWETMDSIEEFTVTFAYSHWTARTTDGVAAHL